MRGPYRLHPSQIHIRVPTRASGVYCLGKNGTVVEYVARADRNLREALITRERDYNMFWYEPTVSPSDCYTTHCRCYHKHAESGHLVDNAHPTPPPGLDMKCPVCGK
jgi:hypothetical protein